MFFRKHRATVWSKRGGGAQHLAVLDLRTNKLRTIAYDASPHMSVEPPLQSSCAYLLLFINSSCLPGRYLCGVHTYLRSKSDNPPASLPPTLFSRTEDEKVCLGSGMDGFWLLTCMPVFRHVG